jgi:hypothetical protein
MVATSISVLVIVSSIVVWAVAVSVTEMVKLSVIVSDTVKLSVSMPTGGPI